MRLSITRMLPIAILAAAAVLTVGCKQAEPRSDAQIAGDVQNKVSADPAIQTKTIGVQAANGVVILTGPVTSDAERTAAASDAAGIAGVRTVVNNLTVAPPTQAAAVEPPSPAPSESPAPEPVAPAPKHRERTKPSAAMRDRRQAQPRERYPESDVTYRQAQPASQQSVAAAQPPVAQAPAPQPSYVPPPPAAPAPPPQPQRPATVTIPDGTRLTIRMIDTVDSETANAGDVFHASLSTPVDLDGQIVIPGDADIMGRVVDAQAAGRFKGAALLTLELTRISFNGRAYAIHTDQWSREIKGRGKSSAEKVGGGAVLGAIIGGIAGGGKGAAIGTVVGGGAGATAQGVTKQKQITLEPEAQLTFRLEQSLTVHPASTNQRNTGRPRLE